MKKLSIIVPVYNVENYIRRCIDSLICLDQANLEIIIVDDGSTDSSSSICNEYSALPNVKVIHKTNGGLSDARNIGLENAWGEYIWFVDSDDAIYDIYSQLEKVMDDFSPDIIAFNYTMHKKNNEIAKKHTCLVEGYSYTGEEYLRKVLENREYYVPVWTNVFSKNFINENGFRFRRGIYHEDEQITPYIFLAAKKVVFVNKYAYKYIIRDNSIANSEKWEKNIKDGFSVFFENADYFKTKIHDVSLKVLLLNDISEKMIYYLCKYNVPQSLSKEYVDVRFLLSNAYGIKNKIRVVLFVHFRSVYDVLFKKNERKKIAY